MRTVSRLQALIFVYASTVVPNLCRVIKNQVGCRCCEAVCNVMGITVRTGSNA